MISQLENDCVFEEWNKNLSKYPALLTPKQVQDASRGIVKAGDIYKRNNKNRKKLILDIRTVGGKIFVTRASLAVVLSGKPVLPV